MSFERQLFFWRQRKEAWFSVVQGMSASLPPPPPSCPKPACSSLKAFAPGHLSPEQSQGLDGSERKGRRGAGAVSLSVGLPLSAG